MTKPIRDYLFADAATLLRDTGRDNSDAINHGVVFAGGAADFSGGYLEMADVGEEAKLCLNLWNGVGVKLKFGRIAIPDQSEFQIAFGTIDDGGNESVAVILDCDSEYNYVRGQVSVFIRVYNNDVHTWTANLGYSAAPIDLELSLNPANNKVTAIVNGVTTPMTNAGPAPEKGGADFQYPVFLGTYNFHGAPHANGFDGTMGSFSIEANSIDWVREVARSVPFVSGVDSTVINFSPGLAERLDGGVIVAFSQARQSSGSDDATSDVVCKRSYDGGRTWSALTTVYSDATWKTNYGDCPVYDENHRLHLVFISRDGTNAEVAAGTAENRVMYTYSDDDSATWSTPIDIRTAAGIPTAWKRIVIGQGGGGIRLQSGRMAWYCNYKTTPGTDYGPDSIPFVLYTDDDGATWSHTDAFDPIGGGVAEMSAVALQSGGALITGRNYTSTQGRRLLWATDETGLPVNPAITDHALVTPLVHMSIAQFPSGRIVHLGPTVSTGTALANRYNLSLKGGQMVGGAGVAWDRYYTVDPDPCIYSCMLRLHSGAIAIIYDRGNLTVDQTFIVIEEVDLPAAPLMPEAIVSRINADPSQNQLEGRLDRRLN